MEEFSMHWQYELHPIGPGENLNVIGKLGVWAPFATPKVIVAGFNPLLKS